MSNQIRAIITGVRSSKLSQFLAEYNPLVSKGRMSYRRRQAIMWRSALDARHNH